MTTTRPVTGPDGDNPITDEQIRELRMRASEEGEGLAIDDDYYSSAVVLTMCDEATGSLDYGDTLAHLPMSTALRLTEERRLWSRSRLADAYNARMGKETP